MHSYQDLLLWQRAMELAEVIYHNTATLPLAERLGLGFQLRRLALAVPLHVAAHDSQRASTFLRGLQRAQRTLRHLEHQLVMAGRLQYWSGEQEEEITRHLAEVQRLLQAFLHSLCPPSES
ncbi:MAG: four helix bundle protein [Planctomycetaceae bacterium]|nr:four helix bundle protein [Planctomycetaceae bacterium]